MARTLSAQGKPGSGAKFIITLPNNIMEMTDTNSKPKTENDEYINELQTQAGKKILLVEDDSINAAYVNRILGKNHSVEIVTEGNEAIIKSKAKKYDLILMDIGLRGNVDGAEATRQIRKDSTNATTPIIALTAYAMAGDKEKILRAGLDDYLSKPFTRNDFFRIVDKYISE
ncbi:MAG: response regulator [Ignavibacteriaceae bacterium]|nr:response regulator [Ignavibacteriaceae bacterium]